METVESPAAFAKRTGLPERLVRAMVKQGMLPHIKPGACHVLIHIEAALDAVKNLAEKNAEEIAATMPIPIRIAPQHHRKSGKKRPGRPPDSVRLAAKNCT